MTSNYDVGYMKPPKDKQFQPGQSGNCQGRPRGRRNTYAELDDILNEKIQMTKDGRPVKISKRMAMLLQATNKAAKGDLKSFLALLPHILIIDAKNAERDAVKNHILAPSDREILDQYLSGDKNEQ